jgi:hypothetical protein
LVLDGIRDPVSILKDGKSKATEFIKSMLLKLTNRSDYEDILNSHIGSHGASRIINIKEKMNLIANL